MKLIINLQHNLNMSAPIMSRFDLFFILVDDCNEVKLIFNKLFFFKVGISKTLLLFTLPLNIPLTKQMKGTKERKEFSDLSVHAQNYTPTQNWLEHFLRTKSMMVLHPSPMLLMAIMSIPSCRPTLRGAEVVPANVFGSVSHEENMHGNNLLDNFHFDNFSLYR